MTCFQRCSSLSYYHNAMAKTNDIVEWTKLYNERSNLAMLSLPVNSVLCIDAYVNQHTARSQCLIICYYEKRKRNEKCNPYSDSFQIMMSSCLRVFFCRMHSIYYLINTKNFICKWKDEHERPELSLWRNKWYSQIDVWEFDLYLCLCDNQS